MTRIIFWSAPLFALLTAAAWAQDETASRAMLDRLIAEKRIVNTHEHIQSVSEAPVLLGGMDANGMGKSLLMGSSWFTITLNPSVGFTRYDWNNDQLLELTRQYPGRFEAWPTLDPVDPDKLSKLKNLVARGATGLKLYAGHGYVVPRANRYIFHPIAMDDPAMFDVYAWCEENFIPVVYHVNPGPTKPGFAQEFIEVLKAFPDMKVIAPHFMLSSIQDSRLRELLDVFPNLYSDISFGHDDFMRDGLRRISRNPDKFRDLFARYPDRFMFGTDYVITDAGFKTVPWFSELTKTYYDVLTRLRYTTPLLPGTELNGLALHPELLEGLLATNYLKFREKRPQGTVIPRDVRWERFGFPKADRRPGEALPPPARGRYWE